jgi:hypothetical protein
MKQIYFVIVLICNSYSRNFIYILELLLIKAKMRHQQSIKLSDIVNDTSIIKEIIPSKYMDRFVFKFSAIIGRNEND